jgi:hypothetical protein
VQRRRRTSAPRAFVVLLLAAALPACAQTVVLEQGTDGGASGGSTGGGNKDGSTSTDGRCFTSQAQKLPFRMQTSEAIVALDRSNGMNTEIGGGMTELSSALNTLFSQVSFYATFIRFGFVDFPDDLGTCPSSCCVSSLYPPPSTASATNTQFFESAAYSCNANGNGMNPLSCPTGNQRPISTALQSCVSSFAMDQQNSPQYVLLITNGEPSGGCGDPHGDCQAAQDQVNALSAANVQTIVIDLSAQSMSGDCLHDFASQQGTAGPPYYYFTDISGLGDSLKTVIGGIASSACNLTLSNPPDDADLVSVSLGGNQIMHDPSNGWSFVGGTTAIRLNGQACQDLTDNNRNSGDLEVLYGCSSAHGAPTNPG